MNIKDSISRLKENQKTAIIAILKKIKDRKILSEKDIGMLGHNMETCTGQYILEAFNITRPTIGAWCEAGCPRNNDGSYNLKMVIEWKLKTEKERCRPASQSEGKEDLEKQKLELQIEKMGIEIAEMKEKNISVETHQQILCSRADGLKRYWTEAFQRNLHLFCHKSIEQVRPLAERFIREALNNYSRTHI